MNTNRTPTASHRVQVRTVVVQISRKLKATYRLRTGRLFSALLAALVSAFSPLARALPDASTANVSAGTTIDTSKANTMVVNQATPKAILDWRSFNIGSGETVRFAQPDAASVALNRVSGGASTIAGALLANGQVFLVNPAGVLFAPGAQVNVGGLVASTLDLSNTDFLNGKYQFSGGGFGSVTNQGSLAGRYVVLAGPTVSNSGTIAAQSVGLLAGSRVTVDPAGAGLVNFSVDAGAVNAAIANSGAITADGGKVAVLASSLSDTLPTVINQSGVIRANSIAQQNGTIVLSGGAKGVVSVSGTLEAKGDNAGETGGTVKVLGDKVALRSTSEISASGDAGGGTVLVGGNWQGKGAEQNASHARMETGAKISADALTSGDGGTVVVWADGSTAVGGAISARGGANAGNGGKVETSGKEILVVAKSASVDASAPHGRVGTWLLDPKNIIVQASGAGAVTGADQFSDTPAASVIIDPGALDAAGATVTLQANNDISVVDAINLTTLGAGLTMQAGRNINVGANITTNNGAITLVANETVANGVVAANRDAGTGGIRVFPASVINAGTAAVSLTVSTGTGPATVGQIQMDGTSGIIGGAVSLANIQSGINVGGTINASTSLTMTAGSSITTLAGGALNAGAGGINLAAAGNITLSDTVGSSTTGTISILADSDENGVGTLANTAAIGNASAGPVTLQGANMTIGSTVRGANVTLQGSTAGQAIDVGGADTATTLGLTAGEINLVSTPGTLTIGSSNAGAINITAAIAPAGTSNLALVTGSSVTETAPGATITTTNLGIAAGGSVVLNGANNVTSLAINAPGQSASFTDSNNFSIGNSVLGSPTGIIAGNVNLASTVGTINQTEALNATTFSGSAGSSMNLMHAGNRIGSLNGITVGNSFFLVDGAGGLTVDAPVSALTTASIETTGSLDVNSTVTATGSSTSTSVYLISTTGVTLDGTVNAPFLYLDGGSGRLTQSAAFHVGRLDARTGGGSPGNEAATLTNAGNTVDTVQGFNTNYGFSLFDSTGGLDLNGLVGAGVGTASITTVGGSLTVAGGLVVGGNVTLAATSGDIALDSTININGTLTLISGGNITQTAALTAGTLTGVVTGAATLNHASNQVATLNGFTTGGGFALNDAGGGLTLAGTVNGGSGQVSIATAGAALALGANTVTGNGVTLSGNGVTQAGAGTVNGGSGDVLVDANDGAINMAGTITTLSNSATAVQIIDGTTAALGNIGTGPGGRVAIGGSGGDALTGAVTQTVGTVINTGTLAVNGGSTVNLGNNNVVATLGPVTANGFTFNDVVGTLTVAGTVNAGAGALAITNSGSLTTNAGGTLAAGAGGISVVAGNNVNLNAAVGSATTGAITILADSDGNGAGVLTNSAAIGNAGAGLVTLQGANMEIGNTVTGANVTLRNSMAGQVIDVGGADGGPTLGFSTTELGHVNTAGTLTIGRDDARATGAVVITAAVAPSGTSNLALRSGGSIVQNAGATVTVANLGLAAGGNVVLNQANEVNTLAISAPGQTVAYTDASSFSIGNSVLGSPTGITAANAIIASIAATIAQTEAIDVTTLTGSAGSSVSLGHAGNRVSSLLGFTSGSSFALVDGAGGLTVDAPVNALQVWLQTGGALDVNSAVTATTSSVSLLATNGITLDAVVSASGQLSLNGGSGAITQSAAFHAAAVTGTTTAGATLTNASNTVVFLTDFTANNGLSFVDSAGGLTVTGQVSGGAGGTSITTTGGTLFVSGYILGGDIALASTSGDILLSGPVTTGGSLTLNSGANITQTVAFDVGTLTGTATGAATLNNAGNRVGTLAGFTTGTGFSLVDSAGGLTVAGPVAGGTGLASITTSGGALDVNAAVTGANVTLAATGNAITLDAPVTTAGTLTLNAGTSISQTAALSAGTLTGNATTGSATLTNAGNVVGTLGAFTTGTGFSLVDSTGGLTVNGVVDGGVGGNTSITTTGGALVVANAVVGNNVTLASTSGDIALDGFVGTGTLTLNAGGNITQTVNFAADTLTGTAAGSVALNLGGNNLVAVNGFTTGGGFDLVDVGGGLALSGTINGGTGPVSIATSGSALALGNSNVIGAGVVLAGNGVTQTAGGMVDGGSGTVVVDANDGTINLAGAITTLSNSATAVQILDAGTTTLGNITTGATGTVRLGAAGADSLNGAVTQNAGTVIDTGTLTVAAASTVDLGNANTVTNLGPTLSSGGFTFNDANGGLTISGGVTDASGPVSITTAGGNLAVNNTITGVGVALAANGAGSDIALGADVVAGTGLAALTADTNITRTTGTVSGSAVILTATNGSIAADVVAGTLSGSAGTSATITGDAAMLDGFTTGSGFSMTDANSLTVVGAVDGGTGPVTLAANGGTLTLQAGGDITAGGTVNLTGSTGITTAGDVTTTNAAVNFNSPTTLTGAVAVSTGSGAITFGDVAGGGNDLSLASTGGVTAGVISGVNAFTTGAGTNVAAASVAAAGGNLGGDVSTTGSQSYTGPLQTAAGTTLTAVGSLTATDSGNVIGDGTQFAITQSGGTGTLDVAGDFAGAVQVSGNATSISLNDGSAATQMVITGLSAAPSANVTLVSAGAMQVDAAALSPVTNLTATAQGGDMVFLNSGTLQGGTPGLLATGSLTLNATGALNTVADPLIINVGTPVVNITASPANTNRQLPPAPAPVADAPAAFDSLLLQAADIAGTLQGQVDELIAADVRYATGLLGTERLVFLGNVAPSALHAPLTSGAMAIRLPLCVSAQQKGEPGCR